MLKLEDRLYFAIVAHLQSIGLVKMMNRQILGALWKGVGESKGD